MAAPSKPRDEKAPESSAAKSQTETKQDDVVIGAAPRTVDGVGQVDEVVNPGQEELQKTVDEANKRGLYGEEVDLTPNDHYTVSGVTAGKPTPETIAADPKDVKHG